MSTENGEYVLQNYGRFDLRIARGEGAYLWDADGRRYLDFCTGLAVCSLGHCHPKLVEAVRAQAGELMHCSNLYHTDGQENLARSISEDLVGAKGQSYFCNSGAEANEAMIKLGRRYGQLVPGADGVRHEIITFTNSFHGRTQGGMAATAQAKIHDGFGPVLPGFRYLPHNDCTALREAASASTAGVMLEIVQGEGGIHVASAEFLQTIAEVCAEHDALILIDDVQAGVGRTGHLRPWETILGGATDSFQPDAITWAKGLGGGFPCGAMWVRDREVGGESIERLPEVLSPGTHGSTFGGTPLACAAMSAVLTEIVEQDLPANARERGAQLIEGIHSMKSPLIRDVRGEGLMVGIVLDEAAVDPPEGRVASLHLVDRLQEAGLIVPPAGTGVVRLLPSLNVTEAEVEEALGLLGGVFGEQ